MGTTLAGHCPATQNLEGMNSTMTHPMHFNTATTSFEPSMLDVPYDQFVREHIAGDLLQNPRLHPKDKFNESVLGTGFWFLGEWVHSPVDIRKDEADRFDNMIDVFSKTFLGVTVACARCHDHKYDAISTADYYSLSGFLQSSDYRQVRFESMEQNRKTAIELAEINTTHQRPNSAPA